MILSLKAPNVSGLPLPPLQPSQLVSRLVLSSRLWLRLWMHCKFACRLAICWKDIIGACGIMDTTSSSRLDYEAYLQDGVSLSYEIPSGMLSSSRHLNMSNPSPTTPSLPGTMEPSTRNISNESPFPHRVTGVYQ